MFGRKKKTPAEILLRIRDCIVVLVVASNAAGEVYTMTSESESKQVRKAQEDLAKYMPLLKSALTEDPGPETTAEALQHATLVLFLRNIHRFSFEARKDMVALFTACVRLHPVLCDVECIDLLLNGYRSPEIALNCGIMLREAVRHESIARLLVTPIKLLPSPTVSAAAVFFDESALSSSPSPPQPSPLSANSSSTNGSHSSASFGSMSLSSLSLSVSASSKDPHHSTSSSHQSQHSQQSLAHHSTSSSSLSSQLSAVGVAVAEPLVISEESARMEHFFAFVDLSNFDVQSDAFATFKEALTKHKPVIAEYMLAHFDSFFGRYNALLSSENYVTRRQSLKLLGELLLDRANFKVMTRYIAVVDHLKRMMTLLKDKSKNIQFEAFHVFKIFVANPNKPPEIKGILYKNQQKLVQFLSEFQNEKEDEQFAEEKALLIREISALQPPEP